MRPRCKPKNPLNKYIVRHNSIVVLYKCILYPSLSYLNEVIGAHDDPTGRVSDPVVRECAPAGLLTDVMTRVLLFLVVTARELVIHYVNDIYRNGFLFTK